MLESCSADLVVVGTGIAGLACALATPGRVLVLTKTDLAESGSSYLARGGIAAALAPGDSPASHADDTLAVACGIADPAVVAALTASSPRRGRGDGRPRRRLCAQGRRQLRPRPRGRARGSPHRPCRRRRHRPPHLRRPARRPAPAAERHPARRLLRLRPAGGPGQRPRPAGLRRRARLAGRAHAPGPARHRRHRRPLHRYDQPARSHGRRARHGRPRRCGPGRPRVRAVPPDGPCRARHRAAPCRS